MTDFVESIRERAGLEYKIATPSGDDPNQPFVDLVKSGEFRKDGLSVTTSPVGEEGPWTESGIPVIESAPAYGRQLMPVRMPVGDFREVQTHIGVALGPDDVTEERFWRTNPDRVESVAAVLRGDEEPDEIFGGIPRPYIEIGSDLSLLSAQEGRHRTVAAEQVGLETIPVAVVYRPDKAGAGGG